MRVRGPALFDASQLVPFFEEPPPRSWGEEVKDPWDWPLGKAVSCCLEASS